MDIPVIQNLLRVSRHVSNLQYFAEVELFAMVTIVAMMITVAAMVTSVRPHLIPPGPRLLPLIGNLHLLYKKDLRKVAGKFRKIYGDIYSLYIGRRLVIFINGKRLMKKAFDIHAETLSDRPRCPIGQTRKGIIHTDGSVWRQQRLFVTSVLRYMCTESDVVESKIAPEMIHLASSLMTLDEQPFDPSKYLEMAVSNVLFSISWGTRFESRSQEITDFHKSLQMVMRPADFNSFLQVPTLFGWIHPFHAYKRKMSIAKKEAELRGFIYQHIKKRQEALDDGREMTCLVDAYLRKMRKDERQKSSSSFDGMNLVQVVMELIYAGTETTAVTLEWMLLYLALNQDCQERAHREIDLILDGAFPTSSDQRRLPYVEAIILESQRLADVTPFSMLHFVRSDTFFDGFSLPSNAILVPNMTSVLHDPKLFPDPEEFKPKRFVGKRGAQLKKAAISPYFIGRRSCLGENVASLEIFLFITALLQHFKFALPNDAPPQEESILGPTRRPSPFKMIAYRRHNLQS